VARLAATDELAFLGAGVPHPTAAVRRNPLRPAWLPISFFAGDEVAVVLNQEIWPSASAILRPTHETDITTARRLAEVLGVPLAYFYAENDDLADMIIAI